MISKVWDANSDFLTTYTSQCVVSKPTSHIIFALYTEKIREALTWVYSVLHVFREIMTSISFGKFFPSL